MKKISLIVLATIIGLALTFFAGCSVKTVENQMGQEECQEVLSAQENTEDILTYDSLEDNISGLVSRCGSCYKEDIGVSVSKCVPSYKEVNEALEGE